MSARRVLKRTAKKKHFEIVATPQKKDPKPLKTKVQDETNTESHVEPAGWGPVGSLGSVGINHGTVNNFYFVVGADKSLKQRTKIIAKLVALGLVIIGTAIGTFIGQSEDFTELAKIAQMIWQ